MSGALHKVAIVGPGTLKGKELKDVFNQASFSAVDIKLLDDDESLGQLDAVGEEITFVQAVRQENFEAVDAAFFASDQAFTRRHWEMARNAGALVVDLSCALENEPGASLRSPWTAQPVVAGEADARVLIPAHPAAVVLALLLERARMAGAVQAAVATVYEPASEQGKRGVDELHQQTINLLSFHQVPTAVYGAQVAFNMLARYGEESPFTLESVERRIAQQFEKISPPQVPVPSLMLVQAPIFHGHVFSVYIELENKVALGDFAQALSGAHVSIARLPADSPTNVAAAGEDDIFVAVRRDVQRENAFWLWAAADNLRVQALSAVQAAQQALEVLKGAKQ